MRRRLITFALTALALCLTLSGCLSNADNAEVWKTDFTGVWELTGDVTDGKKMGDEQLAALKQQGMDCFFVLNEGGTCRMNLCGESFNRGTWTATAPNKARLSFAAITAREEEEAAAAAEAEAEAAAKAGEKVPEETDDEEEEGIQVTATYDFILTFKDNQLHLTVDDRGTLIFDRTTHVAMSDYLDTTATARETSETTVVITGDSGTLGRMLKRLKF